MYLTFSVVAFSSFGREETCVTYVLLLGCLERSITQFAAIRTIELLASVTFPLILAILAFLDVASAARNQLFFLARLAEVLATTPRVITLYQCRATSIVSFVRISTKEFFTFRTFSRIRTKIADSLVATRALALFQIAGAVFTVARGACIVSTSGAAILAALFAMSITSKTAREA